jgi:hypothetical protein
MSIRNIKIIWFLGVKCRRCVWLTTLPPSMSRLSRQCGILNISQSYRPPRRVTGIASLEPQNSVESNVTAFWLALFYLIRKVSHSTVSVQSECLNVCSARNSLLPPYKCRIVTLNLVTTVSVRVVYSIKKKLHGLSPRANYTDRAKTACRRN